MGIGTKLLQTGRVGDVDNVVGMGIKFYRVILYSIDLAGRSYNSVSITMLQQCKHYNATL